MAARLATLRRAVGRASSFVDLTVTNPTAVGLPAAHSELAGILAGAAAAGYDPQPLGLASARGALAEALSSPGDSVDPDDLVLTASTSEAYGFLFKALADPGDSLVTPTPSYPLLAHLAALDGLRLRFARAELSDDFRLDPAAVDRACEPRTRLLAVVHPNHPTGVALGRDELRQLMAVAARRSAGLVVDEVFIDYPLSETARRDGLATLGGVAAEGEGLAVSLGGLSKSLGLPHWKLAWIRLGGPPALRRRARAALELVADSYLSLATPVQVALPQLLAMADRLRAPIQERVLINLQHLAGALRPLPALSLLPPAAGWSAVVRVPRLLPDEGLALALLEGAGVFVHPGYLYDFAGAGFLVVSLLPEPATFAVGCARLVDWFAQRVG